MSKNPRYNEKNPPLPRVDGVRYRKEAADRVLEGRKEMPTLSTKGKRIVESQYLSGRNVEVDADGLVIDHGAIDWEDIPTLRDTRKESPPSVIDESVDTPV